MTASLNNFEATPGIFNNKQHKKKKLKEHSVVEYRAKEQYVQCNCGMEGTPEEYNAHSARYRGNSKPTLDQLTAISEARFDYFAQGSVNLRRGLSDEL